MENFDGHTFYAYLCKKWMFYDFPKLDKKVIPFWHFNAFVCGDS